MVSVKVHVAGAIISITTYCDLLSQLCHTAITQWAEIALYQVPLRWRGRRSRGWSLLIITNLVKTMI